MRHAVRLLVTTLAFVGGAVSAVLLGLFYILGQAGKAQEGTS